MFELIVPATSANLGSGFDCLGLALGLHNRIRVEPATRLVMQVQGEGEGELPAGSDNLLWRSACRLFAHLGVKPPPVCIRMNNAIPLSRGLGSSSAAIVGGLLIANHLTGDQLDRVQLLALATELEGHPDNVAPAIFGGLTVSGSDGVRVESLGFPWPDELSLVACIPAFQLSTQLARQALPTTVAHRDAVFNLSRVGLLLAALLGRRFDLLGMGSDDRLHQPYRLSLIPGGAVALKAAYQAGAVAATISGAGPSLLAMIPPGVSAAAVGVAMVSAFATAGIAAQEMALPVDHQGARVIEI